MRVNSYIDDYCYLAVIASIISSRDAVYNWVIAGKHFIKDGGDQTAAPEVQELSS